MRQFAQMLRGRETARNNAQTPVTDTVIRDRLNRAMRRRMSDDLVSLIRRACLTGHAETAKALWLVLADLIAREAKRGFQHDRRPDEATMQQLALDIAAAEKTAGSADRRPMRPAAPKAQQPAELT